MNKIRKHIFFILPATVLVFIYMLSGDDRADSFFKSVYEKLASDEFQGRGVGTDGCMKAAEYLSNNLKDMGVKPGGTGETFFQPVPMHAVKPLIETEMVLDIGARSDTLTMYEDFFIFNTARRVAMPTPIEIVFAGYGIIAPEFGYNDYKNIDVSDKVVMFMDGLPKQLRAYRQAQILSYRESKQRHAMSMGAAACIFVPNSENFSGTWWAQAKQGFEFEYVSLSYSSGENLFLYLSPFYINQILYPASRSMASIHKDDSSGTVKSFKTGASMTFRSRYSYRDFLSDNVIGIVEGNDEELKREYVLVSAHYDHLGIGPVIDGDSIYNGALDNAIGCAAISELVKRFQKNKLGLRRSLIFVWLTGEESGLLGSRYFCDYPPVELKKIVACVNVDGLAFIDRFTGIIPVGATYSDIGEIVSEVAEEEGCSVSDYTGTNKEDEAFARSDQVAFAAAGIPSVLIMDDVQYETVTPEYGFFVLTDYMKNVYHTPFDDLTIPVNYDASIQHIDFLERLILRLANSDDSPQWDKTSNFYQEYLRNQKK